MKNKVLFFTQVGNGGGAERITANIATMLDKYKYEIKFYAVGRIFKNGICPVPDGTPLCILKNVHIMLFSTIRFFFLLKREKPDFVFCSLQYLNWRLIVASKLVGGIKIIVRNENTIYVNRWYYRYAIKKTYPYADYVIAQQEEMRQEILDCVKINPEKVIVLHNPINIKDIKRKALEDCPFSKESRSVFVAVGRISQYKGQDTLLKAMKYVVSQRNNAVLYIIGKFDTKDVFYKNLILYIKDNKLINNIYLIGYDENPYKWIYNADCFVLPSRLEGLPNVLVEAMALGIPVVATTCIPIIERMIENGKNGYKVSTDDYISMANAMLKSLELKSTGLIYKPACKEDFIKLFK